MVEVSKAIHHGESENRSCAAVESACITLRVYGLIQGVGFRPYVARLALQERLRGFVRNRGGYVEIVLYGVTESGAMAFSERMRADAPRAAVISKIVVDVGSVIEPLPETFSILASDQSDERAITIPPDIAVCDECLEEMRNPADRRYRYPFINCTNCGPRFSIVRDLPYDRSSTTMANLRCARTANRNIETHKPPLPRTTKRLPTMRAETKSI